MPDRVLEKPLIPGVSAHYRSLALSDDPHADPVAAQFVPTAAENVVLPYENPDPISDRAYLKTDRLVHHYRDRVLLLVTDKCATYCRHCFRRHFTGQRAGMLNPQELDEACDYLRDHDEVQEILLSGGDPLFAGDGAVDQLLSRIRSVREDLIIRLSTRMPIMQPSRMSDALIAILRNAQPFWLILHANHIQEFDTEVDAALARIVDAGIPVLNQSVLLRGVNDSVEALETLFRGLVRRRIKPYYLFQGDLAAGTGHFRVPMSRGIELVRELRGRLSGMAMPTYAVDLPGGGGKVPVASPYYLGQKDGWHEFVNLEGRSYRYPEEPETRLI